MCVERRATDTIHFFVPNSIHMDWSRGAEIWLPYVLLRACNKCCNRVQFIRASSFTFSATSATWKDSTDSASQTDVTAGRCVCACAWWAIREIYNFTMLKETSHFVESKVKKLKFQVQVLPTAVFLFTFWWTAGQGHCRSESQMELLKDLTSALVTS